MEQATTKRCSKCGETKPLTEFHKQKGGKDGLRNVCKVCACAATRAYKVANRDAVLLRAARYYKANAGRIKASRKKHHEANLEAHRERANAWARANPHFHAASEGKRRATKLQATPAWADPEAMERIYEAADLTGYHVDHIVPLKSKLVCGLHCEANLQCLPPTENMSKGNRFWPDMPS